MHVLKAKHVIMSEPPLAFRSLRRAIDADGVRACLRVWSSPVRIQRGGTGDFNYKGEIGDLLRAPAFT